MSPYRVGHDDDDDSGDGGDNDVSGLTRGRSAVENEMASCDVAAAESEMRSADVAAGRPRVTEHLLSCRCWARPALLKKRLEQATHSMASAASGCLSRLCRTRHLVETTPGHTLSGHTRLLLRAWACHPVACSVPSAVVESPRRHLTPPRRNGRRR